MDIRRAKLERNGTHKFPSDAPSVVPDAVYPGMWRVQWPDDRLSDMANLARAKDAAACFMETVKRRQRGRHSPLEAPPMRQNESRGRTMSQAVGVCHPQESRRLDILSDAARTMAERVRNGRMPFIDAVDFCNSAAVWADLPDTVGDDAIQIVLADAFMAVPQEATTP